MLCLLILFQVVAKLPVTFGMKMSPDTHPDTYVVQTNGKVYSFQFESVQIAERFGIIMTAMKNGGFIICNEILLPSESNPLSGPTLSRNSCALYFSHDLSNFQC